MKTIILISVFMFLCCIHSTKSQNLIALQHDTVARFYTNIDTAIKYAQNGDYIYLPGGTFSGFKLNKGLHIIGTGHYPDSTVATGITQISGSINIISGSDSGLIEGLYVTGDIKFGNTTDNHPTINNFILSRSSFQNLNFSNRDDSFSRCSNVFVINNVIRGFINGAYSSNTLTISNNIIEGNIKYFNANSLISNNIFLQRDLSTYGCWSFGNGLSTFSGINSSIIKNNIFNIIRTDQAYPLDFFAIPCSGQAPSSYNYVNNNLFIDSIQPSSAYYYNLTQGGSIANNNILFSNPTVPIGIVRSSFINQSGFSFNYSHNYHLKQNSPGKNAGDDGTDVGIYGGNFPYKDGGVPRNPHIEYKFIENVTNQNGRLLINFKVGAQTR